MYESAALCQELYGVSFLSFLRKSMHWDARTREPESDVAVQRRHSEKSGNSLSPTGDFSLAAVSLQATVRISSICSCLRFRSKPCIRPGCGHEHIGLGFRIHPETSSPVVRWRRARRVSRLPVPGRNPVLMRSSIGLLLAENPVASLRKVAGDGDDGAAMSSLSK
jgi:hypothetical protein